MQEPQPNRGGAEADATATMFPFDEMPGTGGNEMDTSWLDLVEDTAQFDVPMLLREPADVQDPWKCFVCAVWNHPSLPECNSCFSPR